jgi:hypothetical protein
MYLNYLKMLLYIIRDLGVKSIARKWRFPWLVRLKGTYLVIFYLFSKQAQIESFILVREKATSFTVWHCLWILCSKFTKIIQTHLTLSLTAICHTA